MRTVKCAAASAAALVVMMLFFTWATWGSSPGTWLPESRFIVGLIALVAAAIAWGVAHGMQENDDA